MEEARVSSVVCNRKSHTIASKNTQNKVGTLEKCNAYDSDDPEDGFTSNRRISLLLYQMRFWLAFAMMFILTIIWVTLLVLMIPWPLKRIKIGNAWGYVNGRLLFWMVGNPVKIEGQEHTRRRAIFVSNHASAVDVLMIMQLLPWGTVGIAKKEIIWYPLFGQIYWLANHLRIDRYSRSAAIASLKQVASVIIENKLSLAIFPEGTRSDDGKLLPFKKGFVHLAMDTGLPIVPIVLINAHKVWKKGDIMMRPGPMAVKILPPIYTDGWDHGNIDEKLEFVLIIV
ncbi:1-acyl-sn-glycerol-3-phosphate acyltransferase-like protein [Drosera capensis]